ncbi:MAG: hypothetical protein ACO1SX_22605 [Actinomycetota bacterium]
MEDRIRAETFGAVRDLHNDDGCFYGNVNLGDRTEGEWAGFPVGFRSWDFHETTCVNSGLQVTDLGSLAEFGRQRPGKSEALQAGERMLGITKA